MIKFRVYVRRGSNKASLKGESQLDGQRLSIDGPLQYNLLINRIQPLKSENPPLREEERTVKDDPTTIFGRISESRNLGNFRVFEMNTTAEMLDEPVATVNEKFLSVRTYETRLFTGKD
ncbi:hypothetical protein WR25_08893 [Diploscapter pachys]|uniref:Uncharacterized protein n=1 Tax=Diploscapter pachys TaxID=2018661 RepID=A0A2A2JB99_9BILA|nr:hypothetical protein WR25_08893 [Diploscapter pachys]